MPIVAPFRYALRQLRKTPVFTAFVVLTLALGVGANTAIFSVMQAVLLRMLPVHDSQQLFFLTHDHGPEGISNTGDYAYTYGINVYRRLREDHTALADVVAYVPLAFNKTAIRIGDTPEEARAEEVSGNFFTALGLQLALGQAFAPADEEKHSTLAVISYGFWNRRFHRSPAVLGQVVYINGVPFTVLGVADSHFHGVEPDGSATDLWIPLQNRPELNAWGLPATGHTLYGSPNWWALMLLARVKPGITPAQAKVAVDPLFARAAYETVGSNAPRSGPPLELNLVPARGLGLNKTFYREPLWVLMGMVGLVLLTACVNIVMLLTARNAARQREFSLRLALGARRWPLLQQLLTESVLLVSAGVVLGWFFALWATRALAAWSRLEVNLEPDSTVLLFTLAIAAAATLLFSLVPMRAASNAPITAILASTNSRASADRTQVLTGRVLVIAQVAVCMTLLFAAGLLIRTLRNYRHIDLGMQADAVLAFGVHPSTPLGTAQILVFYNELLRRVSILPGVTSVTLAENRPGAGWSDNTNAIVDGREFKWDDGKNDLRSNTVGPGFFRTLRIPVTLGREIQVTDTATSLPIAVVNQTFADRYFAGRSPLGHTIGKGKGLVTIVGVVRDSRYSSAGEEPMPMSWYSFQQAPDIPPMDVELSASHSPLKIIP